MVSIPTNAELRSFAVTQFLTDVENSMMPLPGKSDPSRNKDGLHTVFPHLVKINSIYHGKLSDKVEAAGGTLSARLTADEVFNLYDATVKNYFANNAIPAAQKTLLTNFIQIHRGTLVAGFSACLVSTQGERKKQDYIKHEVQENLELIRQYATKTGIPYADAVATTYLQVAAQRSAAESGLPTFYDEVAQAFLAAYLQELKKIAKGAGPQPTFTGEEITRSAVVDRLKVVAQHLGYEPSLLSGLGQQRF